MIFIKNHTLTHTHTCTGLVSYKI